MRDVDRIRVQHGSCSVICLPVPSAQPLEAAHPRPIRVGFVEQAFRSPFGERPEEHRVVHRLLLEQNEQIIAELPDLLAAGGWDAQLPREAACVRLEVAGFETFEHLGRRVDGRVGLARIDQLDERLREAGEVPQGDAGLVAVGVAAPAVDRADTAPRRCSSSTAQGP